MPKQKDYGIRNIKRVSRHCYYVGLGAGFFALICIILILILNIPITKLIPPCYFHEITGFYCPGCGGTRAAISLLHGNIVASFCYHPFVPYAVVYYIVYEGSHTLEIVTRGKIKGLWFCPTYFYIGAAVIVAQCLGKNFWGLWYMFLK